MLKGIGLGLDLEELERQAREKLPEAVYRRIVSGADDEITLERNREAWNSISLAPRVLRGVKSVSTATTVLGTAVSTPVLIAPAGASAYAQHPESEMAVARATAAAGSLMGLSNHAAVTLEQVAAAAPACPRWFQLYVQTDRGWTEELMHRARASGYCAVMLTVDVADGMPGATRAIPTSHPMMTSGFDPSISLADLEWVKSRCGLPVVVKGILRADDAAECVAAGADAIVVSNHGGRMMDTVVTSAEALPRVVDAVGSQVEVYVDSGIRRGHDVLKAIALGARAVFIGRPWLWGLLVHGSDGVQAVIEHLTHELRTTMHLCGVRGVEEIKPHLLWDDKRHA